MSKKEEIVKKIAFYIGIFASVIAIFAESISIYEYFSKNKPFPILISIVAVVLIIIFVICTFFLRQQNSKLKKNENNLQQELEEEEQKYNALNECLEVCENELKEKTCIIKKKDEQLQEWNERLEACKGAFRDPDYISVGYYLIYEDKYDGFRTNLRILECCLDVEILEKNEEIQEDRLQFKWKLEVFNPDPEPVCTANFIYSGDENHEICPDIVVEIGESKREADSSFMNMEVPGEDCFIEINLESEIPGEKKATINIVYVLPKDDFFEKYNSIWLVPDALGFSCMDSFRIRFYSNEKDIYASTRALLKSYRLKGEFKLEDEKNCPFKRLDGNRYGFEGKINKNKLLRDRGYKLMLPPKKKEQANK